MREDKLLWVYCRECYHERDVNPATVPLPPETPVPEVGKHMKATCGWRLNNPFKLTNEKTLASVALRMLSI